MNCIVRVFLVSLLIVLSSVEVFCASSSGTVITLNGDVWISEKRDKWKHLRPGEEIEFGTNIRTGKGALAGILNPDGSMFRISGNSRVVYKPELNEAKKTGFFAILSELFVERIRKRIGGARGEDEKGCPENKAWIELMQPNIVSPQDLEKLFLIAADFAKCGDLAKIAGLFHKLSENYPENDGYKNLANRATNQASIGSAIQMKPKWSVFIKTKAGKQVFGKDQNTIANGDRYRIHYHAQEDSYLYLFLVNPSKPGLDLLFPSEVSKVSQRSGRPFFESHIKAGRKGRVHPKGWGEFAKDQQRLFLWSWSCFSPVSSFEIDEVKKTMINGFHNKGYIPGFNDYLPSLCPSQLIQEYNQQ
jgi:hypothetical protein